MADGQAPDATVLAILVLQHQAVLALAQADVLPLHHLHLVRRGLAQRLSAYKLNVNAYLTPSTIP